MFQVITECDNFLAV